MTADNADTTGKVIRCKAAIAWEANKPLSKLLTFFPLFSLFFAFIFRYFEFFLFEEVGYSGDDPENHWRHSLFY